MKIEKSIDILKKHKSEEKDLEKAIETILQEFDKQEDIIKNAISIFEKNKEKPDIPIREWLYYYDKCCSIKEE